ncbi:MAG: immune inhibitor A [Chloroflexi bacterium]|nr:immune inhibitor A [Chloroflexota bacterium]
MIRRFQPDLEQPISRVVNRDPVSYEVGRQDVFWVADLVDRKMYEVEAELLFVSEHAYWYFKDGYDPPEQALRAAAQTFEETIYPVVTAAFGSEWSPGVDNDPRMTILHSPLRGVAGYYSASDEYPKAVYPFSNEREIIYMNTSSFVGSPAYLGTLAHELQHAVHWAGDPGEETWVNEGLSEVANGLAGYGLSFIDYFIESPATPLTTWASGRDSALPHYGAASLFMEYLAQHYGGHDSLSKLVAQPEDGIEGVTAYLHSLGYEATFQEVFQDWLVANYLDSREVGNNFYEGLNVGVRPSKTMSEYGQHSGAVPQYAGEYVEVRLKEGDALVSFQGQQDTPLLPTSAHSGSYCWWGNRGDSIDSSLTRSFDLSRVSQATLNFWSWYSIEESWDYAYVEVSSDGGESWNILEGGLASPQNSLGLGFGAGYTGQSKGWQEDSVDLTPYAGMEVLLRFEYVTDAALNEDGICIDDISIPEIDYSDDAESDGLWEALGFIRTDNRVPQDYLVQVIEMGAEITVRNMPLTQDLTGNLILRGFGAGLERAIVIVAPIAPKTTQPSSYVLSVGPVP